jgi:RNA polymerase sigma factor (sigma-70 family)
VISFQDAHLLAAADVGRRFRGYVERDDLLSEGHVWALSHKNRMEHYDTDENAKRAQYRLLRDLTMHMEKYARKQKAEALGYSPDDEAFYSIALVGLLLPSVLNEDYDQPLVDSDGRGSVDPAESGTWMAHRADVARAWTEATLSAEQREAIMLTQGLGMSQREAAEVVGCHQTTIEDRCRIGMKKILALLGGDKPQGCPYTCECHEGRLRVRPGIHSEISGKNQELR